MSITKFTLRLTLAMAALVLIAPSARAQHDPLPHEFTPFIDPLTFNPDFQFFAPAELGDFGRPPDPNTGWFGAYNRMYIYVTRPDYVNPPILDPPPTPVLGGDSTTSGDFTWGNRIDIGYMTEDDTGWWLTGIHIDGPNKYQTLVHPLINRFNEEDVDEDDGGDGTGGDTAQTEVFPQQDRNSILTGARDVFLGNSLNVADLSGFELNKVWRLAPLHRGGILEPFVGFRYMKFNDYFQRENYDRFDENGVPVAGPSETEVLEQITVDATEWQNHMVGGQLGIRWSERKSRWLLSGETRAFATQAFQDYHRRDRTFSILYDGGTTGSQVIAEEYLETNIYDHNSEFVFGFDVRAESAFELTRDVSFIMGAQVMHFAKGLARGPYAADEEPFDPEDLTMVGFTFGVTVNR